MKNITYEIKHNFFSMRFKRTAAAILAVLVLISATSVSAYAMHVYGQNEQEVLEQFIAQYGWEREKMEAYSWLGDDGEIHTRQSSYEKSFYDDVYKTNEELAITLGLITEVPLTSGNAASMVALALSEWQAGICETPMGSNRVKYNDWYYGSPVSGDAYPWCCAFISWLADQCGLLASGVYAKTAGCTAMRGHFINKGYASWGIRQSTPFGGTETPIPGDIIIWGNDVHIGLIVAVNGNSIETIEGNAGDRVSHNTYTAGSLTGNFGTATVFRIEYPDNETTIFNFLVNEMHLPPAGAVGVVANIYSESSFNEQALGDNGTSYGICQWHSERWTNLQNFCAGAGLNWQTLDGQLYYLKHELETSYSGVLAKISSVPNTAQGAYDAASAWCIGFERPANMDEKARERGYSAKNTFWPKYEQARLT